MDINYLFYQSFAGPFSASRQRLQPGVRRVLASLAGDERILDVGCGNGNLRQELVSRGHRGAYTGLDFSPKLLEYARGRLTGGHMTPGNAVTPIFILVDLSQERWALNLPLQSFDLALSFAVLHHIPGKAMRSQLLSTARQLLVPGGKLVFSAWQFMNSPRLRRRVQDWSLVGIDPGMVDEGDYLLDWRAGGSGLRYVHLFNPPELSQLAQACGFQVIETFFSDGIEGNLGCYQVWETAKG